MIWMLWTMTKTPENIASRKLLNKISHKLYVLDITVRRQSRMLQYNVFKMRLWLPIMHNPINEHIAAILEYTDMSTEMSVGENPYINDVDSHVTSSRSDVV